MMVTKTIIGAYSPMKMEQMFLMVERLETGFLQKAEILLLIFFKRFDLPLLQNPKTVFTCEAKLSRIL